MSTIVICVADSEKRRRGVPCCCSHAHEISLTRPLDGGSIHAMAVSLHECSSKAENRELSQNKARQGQKSSEKKHKDNNIQYFSTLPISAGKSTRSRSSLSHAEIPKGGFDPVKNRNRTKMALDAKMAINRSGLCQPFYLFIYSPV